MLPTIITSSELFSMLFIFFARIIDVSLGTMRIILIARGYRSLAPIFGFLEVFIWLGAIGTTISNLHSIFSYFIYAGGFAAGNYVGMLIEERVSIGYQLIRIITTKEVTALPMVMREEGYGVTVVDGKGMRGDVYILYAVVRRSEVKKILGIVETFEPSAFITVEDVRSHIAGFIGDKGGPPFFGRMFAKRK